MTARNTEDTKRFIYRPPVKETENYFSPVNKSESNTLSRRTEVIRVPSTTNRLAEMTTSNAEVASVPRRVVVVRNPKQPQPDQRSIDLGELPNTNSVGTPPITQDSNKPLYLIRRPIPQNQSRPVGSHEPVEEQPTTASLENKRTPTPPPPPPPLPPPETITLPNRIHSPTPRHSPPIRPKTSKHTTSSIPDEDIEYIPYLRRPRSKIQTTSPNHAYSTHRSPSPDRRRSPTPRRRRLPILEQEKVENIDRQHQSVTHYLSHNMNKQASLPRSVVVEDEQRPAKRYRTPSMKSTQEKQSIVPRVKSDSMRVKTTSARTKSAKSIVLINPDDQSIAVIENSYVKGEPLKPVVKRPKSVKRKQFQETSDDQSTERLVEASRPQRCLGCLSRHMCLVIVICSIIFIIGLAGVGVSAYFLASDSSNAVVPKIVGIVVGAVLAIAALCFLCIVLGCIGSRDGYFTYTDDDPTVGGRVYALIPPTHPNAHLYIPRDYMKMIENSDYSMAQVPMRSDSKASYYQSSAPVAVSIQSPTPQHAVYRLNTPTRRPEYHSTRHNITIEMPERLLTGRKISPRSRERSINKVVKNIGHIVDDAKKRYHGDVPNKVIVKVDKNAIQTA